MNVQSTASVSTSSNVEASNISKQRESGIELLKVISIFLIVLCHVTNTLQGGACNESVLGEFVLNYSKPGSGITNLILSIILYSGMLGNLIFIVSSSWFLVDRNKCNYKKLLRIFIDVFVISILCLLATGMYTGFSKITHKDIIYSFLPNYFANNWYITYYIVIALISPGLNWIIKNLNQQSHFILSIVLFALIFILGFVTGPAFNNLLITWISIYFIVAYFKLYGEKFCDSIKPNVILVIIGLLGIISVIILTYYLGSKFSIFKDTTRWNKLNNPFHLLISLGSFNLVRKIKFKSKFVNYISSLSLLTYIIHENLLLRSYIRPLVWNYIYTSYGYHLVLLWVLIFTVILFISSILVSALYNISLQKLIHKLSDKIFTLLSKLTNWTKTTLIKIIK